MAVDRANGRVGIVDDNERAESMAEKFTYPVGEVVLSTVPEATRKTQQARILATVPRAAALVDGFNVRLLRNEAALEDLVWFFHAFQRLDGLKPEGWDRFGLPTDTGMNGQSVLLKRLARLSFMTWLLFPRLPAEKAPEVPKWIDGSELRNPYLVELDDDVEARNDRVWLEQNRPELAEYLKVSARGGPTYREHAQSIEDQRLAKAAREFDGANPFDAKAEFANEVERTLAQKAIWDRNRILGEQLRDEAARGAWNPFNVPGNITNQMLAYRQDLALSFVMSVAGRYRDMQTAEEIGVLEREAADRRVAAGNRNAADALGRARGQR